MAKQIFVNLPVENVQRSIRFFESLGFAFDPKFTDEKAGCLILGENMYAMLLGEEFFKTFTKKTICDATNSTEVLVAITCDSRSQVDDLVARAVKAGGKISREPEDHGFMYGHAFEDPDGHIWEPFYMQPEA